MPNSCRDCFGSVLFADGGGNRPSFGGSFGGGGDNLGGLLVPFGSYGDCASFLKRAINCNCSLAAPVLFMYRGFAFVDPICTFLVDGIVRKIPSADVVTIEVLGAFGEFFFFPSLASGASPFHVR